MIIGILTSPSPSIKSCPIHLLASWTLGSWSFGKEIIAEWQSRAELRRTLWEREFCQIPDELCETRLAGILSKEDHDVRALVVIVLSYLNINDSTIGSMIVFVHYIMQFHSFLSDWSIVIKAWNITLHVFSLIFMCTGIWMHRAHRSWPVLLGTEAPLLLQQQQRRNHGKRYIAILYFVTRNQ